MAVSIFARFTEDGRICLTTNVIRQAPRRVAADWKSRLFAGSDHRRLIGRGGCPAV